MSAMKQLTAAIKTVQTLMDRTLVLVLLAIRFMLMDTHALVTLMS